MIKQIESFIEGSRTFGGITFRGCYTMNNKIFLKLLTNYIETGENHLDLYSELIYLLWECEDRSSDKHNTIYDYNQLEVYDSHLSIARRLKLFSLDDIYDLKAYLRRKRIDYTKFLENKRNEPRRKSCRFTALPEIKNYIYNKYGKKCLCCGTTKNISLDHVIPVFKGGIDDISNLQPLCMSCNSRKGINTTDYRTNPKIKNTHEYIQPK